MKYIAFYTTSQNYLLAEIAEQKPGPSGRFSNELRITLGRVYLQDFSIVEFDRYKKGSKIYSGKSAVFDDLSEAIKSFIKQVFGDRN